jgi:hypothetical protein
MIKTLIRKKALCMLLLAAPLCIVFSFRKKDIAETINNPVMERHLVKGPLIQPTLTRPFPWGIQKLGIVMAPGQKWNVYHFKPTKKTAATTDEPNEGNLTIHSNPWIGDGTGGSACLGYEYSVWTDFPGYTHTWYLLNCHIDYTWSQDWVRVVFDSGLHTEGWASIGVEVKDSNGTPFYYEISVTESNGCDIPDPLTIKK